MVIFVLHTNSGTYQKPQQSFLVVFVLSEKLEHRLELSTRRHVQQGIVNSIRRDNCTLNGVSLHLKDICLQCRCFDKHLNCGNKIPKMETATAKETLVGVVLAARFLCNQFFLVGLNQRTTKLVFPMKLSLSWPLCR